MDDPIYTLALGVAGGLVKPAIDWVTGKSEERRQRLEKLEKDAAELKKQTETQADKITEIEVAREVRRLEAEQLRQELAAVRLAAMGTQRQLRRVVAELRLTKASLDGSQEKIAQLEAQVAALTAERDELRAREDKLKLDLDTAATET